MSEAADLLEKIRRQFDSAPYPASASIEEPPEVDADKLFLHSLVTPHYLKNQRVVDPKDKIILDAGCGNGFKALTLAIANPGAKIVGVDLSEESINLARRRFQLHGFDNAKFYTGSIEDLPQLNLEFDYINCDDVLYFFSDLEAGLSIIKSVLKPQGIIRGNLHSTPQRVYYLRAQEVFRTMGLMDANPEELEIEIVLETMTALKDQVDLKVRTWNSKFTSPKEGKQKVLANYLLQGDRGYTIPELMTTLKAVNLEFISLVDWQQWDLLDLFQEPDNLPEFWKEQLPEMSIERRLELFELLQPNHRLLDFWCTHSGQSGSDLSVSEWSLSDWQNATVYLHPALKIPQIKSDLKQAIQQQRPLEISQYIPGSSKVPLLLDVGTLAYLSPLWEAAQRVDFLVDHWLKFQPVNPVTTEPMSQQEAFEQVKQALTRLTTPLYVLLERSP